MFHVVALLVTPLLAQIRLNGARVEIPPQKPTVYVRDSAVAAEKLALAQRMERLKEWNKSADVYQEIIEKYADRVVPAEDAGDAAGAPTRYTSVTLKVQSLLGKWPEEGLAVYRARYEAQAAALLESADVDDAATLNRVVQRYFPTDAAKNAALRLMELYIENGEFSAAAWLGERLLVAHPGLANDRVNVIFRTALTQHMAGDDTDAKAKAEELKQQFADARGKVMGKDVVLASEAAKMLEQPPPVARGNAADSWPTFGGDATRGRVPEAGGKPGAKVAEVPFLRAKPRPMPGNPEARGQLEAIMKGRREAGLTLGIMPAVDRGELFFQDNSRIYGVSVDTGYTLPGWTMIYGGDADKRFENEGQPFLPSTSQLSVTVTEAFVLAVLGQSDSVYYMNEVGGIAPGRSETPLVCVDRTSGAKRWSASPAQFPETMANLKSLKMNGSPLVIGDNVYIAARGGKPMQFDDSYVLCFALMDGKLRWACYLASGNAPDGNFNPMLPASEAVTHLAYAGGRIYAVTNLGAIAAVDAYTGTIAWLNIYPKPAGRDAAMFNFAARQNGLPSRQRKPWSQNSAIVRDGKVFALPSDSASVLIYDAASGEEIRRISMGDFENASTLLGVSGDKLIVAGFNKIYSLDWTAYKAEKPADSLHWVKQVGVVGMTEEESRDIIRGRGFVTSDSVFVPTKAGLQRISLAGGKVEETYPKDGGWPSGEGPGNVLVTQDQVIIAGADSIVVYSDLALARAKLDQAIAEAPNDAMPRLKYAETLFAAGEAEAAVAKLDEAIALLGGLNGMKPGAERDRAFARAMTFAERSADPKAGVTNPERAASLYDRAAAAANSPQQQVSWRLSRARFARTKQDFNSEVRLYQEILSDPKLRSVSVPAENGSGVVLVASVAEDAINQRLRSTPAAYAPFERAAREAFDTAKKSNDPTQMLAVAQMYPNAKVAIEAMFAAAETYEAAGKPRPATGVLNTLYRKHRDSADKPRILEALARNYLQLPEGVGVAIGRLSEGAKIGSPTLNKPLKLPDNSTIEGVTFGAAAELLQKYSSDIAMATLPEFNLPTTGKNSQPFAAKTPQSVIPDVDRLVLAPRELRKFARFDRIVTWTAEKGINIYAVGTNTAVGASSAILQEPRGGIWLGNDLLVWTVQKIALLRGDGGATAWEVSINNLPPAEIAAGDVEMQQDQPPADGQRDRVIVGPGAVIIDNQVFRIRNGRVFQGGAAMVPQRQQPGRGGQGGGEQIEHVRPVGDRVVIATSSGRIAAIELSSGETAWQTRVSEGELKQVVSTDDFVAVRFIDNFGAQIVALETFTGQIVWRRAFSIDGGLAPVNMTFSPDGTLLYTLPDRLCGVDVYEPGRGLKFGDRPNPEGQQVFAGAEGPEQLVVADGRVLALADNGQFLRVLSPDDGKELPRMQAIQTGANNFAVQFRVVGSRLYVINQKTVLSYNLDKPEENWTGTIIPDSAVNVRDAFVGKKHIVLLSEPTEMGVEPAASSTHFRLLAYGRYTRANSTAEVARLEHAPDITDPSSIEVDQWQAVDGGFYYRSVDRQAHFLKGSASGG